MDPGVPGLLPVNDPFIAVTDCSGLHVCGIGAVIGFCDTKSEALSAVQKIVEPIGFLLLGSVGDHQEKAHVVANDGVLVLQVVVKAESLACEMFANDCHAEVGAVAAAKLI